MGRVSSSRVRLRRAAVAACVVAALAAGAIVGGRTGEQDPTTATTAPTEPAPAPPPPSPPRAAPAERLTLAEQVGQTLMVRFEGTRLPGETRRLLRSGRASGVILFDDNVASGRQVRRLTGDVQGAAEGSALVATDQEGGPVKRLPSAGPEPAPAVQADPAAARDAARRAGRELDSLGVNVNLAPVADVPTKPKSIVRSRAFPGDTGRVAAFVAAAVRGWRSAGVAATAKHFPGIGAATRNTDLAPARIDRSRKRLAELDLPPFEAASEARAPLVMAGHARYAAYDRDRIASQSRPILTDLLRDELGYDGVAITDSLEARASLDASSGSVSRAAVRSIRAGADVALMTGSASHGVVYDRLLSRARDSSRLRARVEEAAGRVLALKRELRLKAVQGGG